MSEHSWTAGQLPRVSLTERATRYLSSCDPAVSGASGHNTTFRVACVLVHGFALSLTEAFRLLKDYNQRCQPPWSDAELRHKILSAASAVCSRGRGYLLGEGVNIASPQSSPLPNLVSSSAPKWPAPDLNAIDQIVRSGPGAYDLWESSPVRWEDEASHTEEIVDTVFPGNPFLCAGSNAYSFETRRREDWHGLLSALALLTPNPMVAPTGITKEGRASQHTLQATARRIYQVIEFDFAETDHNGKQTGYVPLLADWKAQRISILDACAALIAHLAKRLPSWLLFLDSGGKSGHAWFLVRGLPISEQRAFFAEAVGLGADPQLWTRSQFVRIPDGMRENGRRQVILYFDPRNAVTL